jgi:MFS superfamily sulfate permease-like transporter
MLGCCELHRKLSWMRPLGPLTVTVLSILLVWAARLDVSPGVKIVGHIPAGLPPMTVDLWFPMPYFEALMPVAITMTAVGLMESIAIAKVR